MATETVERVDGGSGAAWRVVQWLTAAWALALACICVVRNRVWLQDDTFITMRYAKHLAEGHGPVWNVTGAPVEGFSSPLHLLMVTALTAVHVPPVVGVRALGFGFHAVLVVFVWRYVRRACGDIAGVLAGAMVLASWPLLLWDLGGLDAVPFGALVSIGALVTLRYIETGERRDVLAGGLLLGLAVFMRPDGAVIAAGALGVCVLLGRERLSKRLVDVLLGGLLCAAMVLPWEIFRLAYFHDKLPNTYYAKVFGVPLGWRIHSGLMYWRTYVFKAPYLVPLLGVMAVVMVMKRKVSRFDVGLWAVMAGYALYLLDCGGDHMPGYRFMVALVPLFAVAVVRGLTRVGALKTAVMAAGISVVMMAATAMQMRVQMLDLVAGDGSALIGSDVGKYMNAHWKPGSVVALNVAGAMPFYADGLTYIDMLGLNDYAIARRNPVPVDGEWINLVGHLKGDGASVLARRPDYIVLGGAQGLAPEYAGRKFLGDYELTKLPAFAAEYKACQATVELSDYVDEHLRIEHPPHAIPFFYYQRQDLAEACEGTDR